MDDDDVHLYCYSKTRRFMAFPKKLDGLAVKKVVVWIQPILWVHWG